MKSLVLLLSIIILPFSHAATLTSNNGVQIIAIDGSKHKSGFLNKKIPELSVGKHQIVVQYENSFKSKGLVSSKPHIFDIDITDDTTISVKKYNSQFQAESAIKRGLTWIVIDSQNTYEIVGSDTIYGEGMLPNSGIEKLIAEYNKQQGNSLVPVAAVASTALVASTSTSTPITSATKQQLIDTYNAASKEQQKAFRIWLIEQDMK
jgi:uncharacterized protein YccT (UPF0319 family)